MILINLLPPQLIPKETRKVHIPYRPILFGVFSIFLLISLYNLFFYVRIHKEKRLLETRWDGLKNSYNEAMQLDRELGSSVLAEIEFYNTFVDPPLETARVMNLVSDFLPKAVWLSSFKVERKGKELQLLMIGLSQSSERDSRLVEIQNFANQIKDEMERLRSQGISPGGLMKPTLTSSVTTSSKNQDSGASALTEFTAVIQTEGFEAKG